MEVITFIYAAFQFIMGAVIVIAVIAGIVSFFLSTHYDKR